MKVSKGNDSPRPCGGALQRAAPGRSSRQFTIFMPAWAWGSPHTPHLPLHRVEDAPATAATPRARAEAPHESSHGKPPGVWGCDHRALPPPRGYPPGKVACSPMLSSHPRSHRGTRPLPAPERSKRKYTPAPRHASATTPAGWRAATGWRIGVSFSTPEYHHTSAMSRAEKRSLFFQRARWAHVAPHACMQFKITEMMVSISSGFDSAMRMTSATRVASARRFLPSAKRAPLRSRK